MAFGEVTNDWKDSTAPLDDPAPEAPVAAPAAETVDAEAPEAPKVTLQLVADYFDEGDAVSDVSVQLPEGDDVTFVAGKTYDFDPHTAELLLASPAVEAAE